jgi:predicted MPP superfamily phosphohydrolase
MPTVWQPGTVHRWAKAVTPLAAVAAAGLAYGGGYEVRAFTLRRFEVPVLPPGARPVKVLHVSDMHLVPSQHAKRRWVSRLAELEPDLVVNTGDNLGGHTAVPAVLDTLGPLLDVPGVFVFGSNDYYAPILKNPVRYLLPSGQDRRRVGTPLPWPELREAFLAAGWVDLTNRREQVKVAGMRVSFAGVDDPHLGRDDLDAVAGLADPDAELRIGVTHAPYVRVLDGLTRDGYDLVMAGHTHGGQLCVPFYGALVTNCDLDTERVKGLHEHTADGRRSLLHVSAGLGTSRFAPVRFACRPEASLLTLLPVS